MRRFLSATLALALLSGTAAYADPYGHGSRSGHHERWDGGRDYRYHHGDGAGAAVAVGFGLLALTAILASQDHERDRAPDYDNYSPPPPNGQDYDRNDGPNDGQDYDQGQDTRQDQGYSQDYRDQDNQDQPLADRSRPQDR